MPLAGLHTIRIVNGKTTTKIRFENQNNNQVKMLILRSVFFVLLFLRYPHTRASSKYIVALDGLMEMLLKYQTPKDKMCERDRI